MSTTCTNRDTYYRCPCDVDSEFFVCSLGVSIEHFMSTNFTNHDVYFHQDRDVYRSWWTAICIFLKEAPNVYSNFCTRPRAVIACFTPSVQTLLQLRNKCKILHICTTNLKNKCSKRVLVCDNEKNNSQSMTANNMPPFLAIRGMTWTETIESTTEMAA